MEGLHAYNEMKDIGQMLLGRLGKFQSKKDGSNIQSFSYYTVSARTG